MKRKAQVLWILLVSGVLQLLYVSAALSAGEVLTPESFSKRIILQPSITRLIEEDNVEIALKQLNVMHSKMAEKGWILFNLLEFIDDEDFEGFFVTYTKEKTTSL